MLNKKIMIIDALNMFLRSYVVNPSLNSNGEPIGGFYGFLKSLQKCIREIDPDEVHICWDGPGGAKRKHNSTQGKQRANGGMKRKSTAGFVQMLSAIPAHCHSSSANCDTHSAGGSMRVGDATSIEVLRMTVMQ